VVNSGVYVHIPFCSKRCDYCAFATWTDREHLVGKYLDAVRLDIQRAVQAGMAPVSSVFVGGGTPSLVPPEALIEVLADIPRTGDAEVTIECNPDDVTAEMMRVFHHGGVNRISLGVQSMASHVLHTLGRTHDPDNVARAVGHLRAAGIPTFNLDIIYGTAGESLADWEFTVTSVLALDPPHLSAYGLTVEAGTPLAATPERYPDDDDQADKYDLVDELLEASGRPWYEVSNWAKPGHECRHNLMTWSQGDYRGFGCAAHSHVAGRRWWNVRTPDRYIDLVEGNQSVEAAGETLDAEARRLERLHLLLRTRTGVPANAFSTHDADVLEGLVQCVDGRCVLTRAGRLLANEVSLRVR
jgi:putative oxygen-independent coproporphyrinogen III oxidase